MLRLTLLAAGLVGFADASSRQHYTRGDSHPARSRKYEDQLFSRAGSSIRLPDLKDRGLPFVPEAEYEPPMRVEFVSWQPRCVGLIQLTQTGTKRQPVQGTDRLASCPAQDHTRAQSAQPDRVRCVQRCSIARS